MRTLLRWLVTGVIALAALVGLITLLNSRDQSNVAQHGSATGGGPGETYRGQPPLSARLRHAVRLGNVVVFYRAKKPRQLEQPGGAAAERAGQAVLLKRDSTLRVPLAAVSSHRVEQANSASELQDFVDYWLGR